MLKLYNNLAIFTSLKFLLPNIQILLFNSNNAAKVLAKLLSQTVVDQSCGRGRIGCFLLEAEAQPTKNYRFSFHLVLP